MLNFFHLTEQEISYPVQIILIIQFPLILLHIDSYPLPNHPTPPTHGIRKTQYFVSANLSHPASTRSSLKPSPQPRRAVRRRNKAEMMITVPRVCMHVGGGRKARWLGKNVRGWDDVCMTDCLFGVWIDGMDGWMEGWMEGWLDIYIQREWPAYFTFLLEYQIKSIQFSSSQLNSTLFRSTQVTSSESTQNSNQAIS
jgi:hypothetical protein